MPESITKSRQGKSKQEAEHVSIKTLAGAVKIFTLLMTFNRDA